MNKTILTLVVAAFLATNARAALLLSDDFNSYPDGSLVGAPGSPWIHHSGSTTGEVNVVSGRVDRKSTRLNSSHSQISYAVFCLKKKKKTILPIRCASFPFLPVSSRPAFVRRRS